MVRNRHRVGKKILVRRVGKMPKLLPMVADTFRPFITELARRSGEFILPFYGRNELPVEFKADQSPVTAADRGAEQLLRKLINERYPEHGVIGEEYGEDKPEAEFVWVLDPIDGTKAFTTAVPLYGTLIALMHYGQPILGAIHQPNQAQLMIGDGRTTTLNDRPVRVRPCHELSQATFLTSDPIFPHRYQNGPAYEATIRKARLVRTWADCYGYLLLCSGWADVVVDPIMNTWDIQALIPIVRGAGGLITDWHGDDPVKADSIIATGNRALHDEVLRSLHP